MSVNAAESFRCPSCDEHFSFSNWEDPRIPQLLQCSHSICKSCAKLQEVLLPGQVRCAKCHEQTEFDAEKGLPKNFYLLGLLQNFWQQTQTGVAQSVDETKECQCGKAVSTCCDRCEVLLCLPCFEDTHQRGFLRKHKLIDKRQKKAVAKIQQLRSSVKSTANKEKNAKHLPELRKLKESLSAALEESSTVLEKFEEQREEYRKQCDKACRSVDVKLAELIALLQNLSEERKAEIHSALEKYEKRVEREVNKEGWLEDINNLKAAVLAIENIINNNDQDLDYEAFIQLLEKSVSARVPQLEIPPINTNCFGIEIDNEMDPGRIKKRVKVYAKLPAAGASTTRDRDNWKPLPLTEIQVPALNPKKKSQENLKKQESMQPSALQPSTSTAAEKLKSTPKKFQYRLQKSPALAPQPPAQVSTPQTVEESSSDSDCFSDEEDLKAARKANKKKALAMSTSDTGSVKIIHHKSDLSLTSHIDECMLTRDTIPRPKPTTTRGSFKPTHSTIASNSNHSKFKSKEWQPKKYEIPDQTLVPFGYFEAKISYFASFDEFYVQQLGKESLSEMVKELNNFYNDTVNQKIWLWAKVSYYGVYKFADVWHRCSVLKVLPDHYEVFLVDVGRKLKILKAELKQMPSFLTKYPKAAIKCRLADIKKSPASRCYTEKAIKAFKKLAMSSNGSMTVCVVKDSTDAIPVVIYTFPNNGLKINLNAYLAENFACVVSTGHDSVGTISKDEESEPPKKSPIQGHSASLKATSKKLEVEFLSAESPGKFYASFKTLEQDFENQDLCIQNDAMLLNNFKQLRGCGKEIWKVGDFCYLQQSIDTTEPKWYRATVTGTLEWTSEQLDVFLVDKGITIRVAPDKLVDAPNCMPSNRPPAAKKMHLADEIPLGGAATWNRSSIEQFKKVIQGFNNFCVSDVGEKDANGSLPVKLWGVTATNALITRQREFHDIGAYLANEGYVDRKLKPSKTDFQQNASADVDSKNTPHPINSWIPTLPVKIGEFQGIPTEVDENGVIFIQTRDQHTLFNELKVNLTSKYLIYDIERTPMDLKVGQAVIVHQKVTGEFHRGVIEKIVQETDYKVRLVDTGIVESAERKDLYMNVVAADMPVLCQKFRLSSVVPTNVANCAWPATTLEFIHGEIVDKGVTVVVTDIGDINNCSIRIDEKFQEIETILIDAGMARWRKLDDAWPDGCQSKDDDEANHHISVRDHLTSMQEKVREERINQIARALLRPESVEVSPEETKRFLRGVAADCNKEISESVMSLGSAKSLKSTSSSRKGAPKATIHTSNVFETVYAKSKSRKRAGIRPPKQIHFFDLQAADIDRFRCTFTNVYSKTKLYVTPQIQELQERSEDLDRALDALEETMLVKFRHLQDAVNEMCLVNIQQKWHRAMITSVSADDLLVDVFLLDTTECATVDVTNVFKMDLKLQKFPKKTLVVVLDEFKVNPKLEDHEIEKLVASTLKNRVLKAIVKCHDDKNFPVVELKDENDCLAYQALIDKKVFIEIAPSAV